MNLAHNALRGKALRLALCGFVAALFAPISVAVAEPPLVITPAPNGSFELDQDTPDNSISVWRLGPLVNVNAVRAKLTVRRVGATGANPTFGLELSNDSDRVMFQAFTKPGKAMLIPLVTEDADHSEKDGLAGGVFLSTFEVGETVDVEVDWTDAGVVDVVLRDKAAQAFNGYERHTVRMRGGAPTAVKVISMTGEAEWKPLQLGKSSGHR